MYALDLVRVVALEQRLELALRDSKGRDLGPHVADHQARHADVGLDDAK